MFIRIGQSFLSPDEVAAIAPDIYDNALIRIFLIGGKVVHVKATIDEAERALVSSGLYESEFVELSGDDIKALEDLYSTGLQFIAKDKTGTVYAFRSEPVKCGVYWQPASDYERAERVYAGDFEWLDCASAVAIADFLTETED